jgi:hypothetical protein
LLAAVKSLGLMDVVLPVTVLSIPVQTQPCQSALLTFQSVFVE